MPADASEIERLGEIDRTLIDELLVFERAADRNYRWVCDLIAPWLGRSLLEVGSGVGVVSRHLVALGRPIVLSDHHPAYLAHLRARFGGERNVDFRVLDLESDAWDLADRALDTIVCLNVLEHLSDDRAALARLFRQLPPAGRLVLQVPNYPALFGSLDESYGHHRRYTRASLHARLVEAGFEVVALRPFNPLAVPGWLVSGRVLRSRRVHPGALRLFNAVVPIARRLDFLSRLGGLALLACAEKPRGASGA